MVMVGIGITVTIKSMEIEEVKDFNFRVAEFATKNGLVITLFVGTDFQDRFIRSDVFEDQLACEDCDDPTVMELDVGLKTLHKKILGDFINNDLKKNYDNKTLGGDVHDS